MDRRGYLLFGAAAVCAGLTSGFREFEVSGLVGRTRDTSGLLSIVELDDRVRPYFDADPATFSGTGDRSVEFGSDGGFTMVLASHESTGGFSVTAEDSMGGEPETIIETAGSGASLTGVGMATTSYTLSVAGSGGWELTLAQPRSPAEAVREPPARATGTGEAIVGPLDTTDGALVRAVHEGDGPFAASLFLEASTGVFDPDVLFETTGPVDDAVSTAVAGVAWVVVRTAGSWTLEFELPQ
jgi:hypothetical protein